MSPTDISAQNAIIADAARGAFKTPVWNVYTRTVKAGGLEIVDAIGTFAYVKEASGPLLIAFDNGPDMPVDVGTGMQANRQGDVFQKIIFRNPFATDVTVSVWAGYGVFIDNRFTLVASRDFALKVMDAPCVTYGCPTVNIANGATVSFLGVPAGTQIRRRSLLISNMDPNGRLEIKDALGNFCAAIEKASSQIYFSSGRLDLVNNSGAAIAFHASEVWYDTAG